MLPSYAVVVTFSFDPSVSVLLFDDWNSAMEFIKKDVEEEWRIDTQENGLCSAYELFEAEGRAVLTTNYNGYEETTEWRIGDIYEHEGGSV